MGARGTGVIDPARPGWPRIAADAPAFPAIGPGEPVRILSGPFADIVGICGRTGARRVEVLLSVLGAAMRTVVPRGNVTLVDPKGV